MPTMPKRNYFDRNGSRWVVQGELLIKAGAKVTVEPGAELPGDMLGGTPAQEVDYELLVNAVAERVVKKLPEAELVHGSVAVDPGECKATTVAACVAWCNQLRKNLLDAGVLGEVLASPADAPTAPSAAAPAS